jgi:hypothetical protein
MPEHVKAINNDDDLIEEFGLSLIEMNKLTKLFPDTKSGTFTYNHKLKLYGVPDLVTQTCIIDIKAYQGNIINSKNYVQLLLYAMILEKKDIAMYNPLRGEVYSMTISDRYYNKLYTLLEKNSMFYKKFI